MRTITAISFPVSYYLNDPRLGDIGAKKVLISIDPSLLKRADAYAKTNRMTRSAPFSRAVAQSITAG